MCNENHNQKANSSENVILKSKVVIIICCLIVCGLTICVSSYFLGFSSSVHLKKQIDGSIHTIFLISAFLTALVAVVLVVLYFCLIRYISKSDSKQNFDSLTGCSNWNKFSHDFANSLKGTKLAKENSSCKYAYVLMNIRNFKYINDILGYDVGNQLLIHITSVLFDRLGKKGLFTRINADRYCFIISHQNNVDLLDRIIEIENDIKIFNFKNNSKFDMHIDFGIYKITDINISLSVINDRALMAMQDIKNSNDTNVGFYNSSARQKVLDKRELENDMVTALSTNEFKVFLQPKFDLITQKVIGAEALVRWNHSTKGLLPPSQFIDLFESNGFIVKLDFYMFEETCKLLRKWIDSGKETFPISVNLSRVHLYNPNVAEELYGITLKYHIDPKLIEIELTESLNFENVGMLYGIVSRLKYFNFTVSIDDFGTGYSSLHMLKDLPVDTIKIDKEFLDEGSEYDRGKKVIASIIDMAKRLDMKTVAEGVEEKNQADFLLSVDCDYVQGFYFSKPISAEEFQKSYIENI